MPENLVKFYFPATAKMLDENFSGTKYTLQQDDYYFFSGSLMEAVNSLYTSNYLQQHGEKVAICEAIVGGKTVRELIAHTVFSNSSGVVSVHLVTIFWITRADMNLNLINVER